VPSVKKIIVAYLKHRNKNIGEAVEDAVNQEREDNK
jgi:hypothetical protein